jgi:hypothetical protein
VHGAAVKRSPFHTANITITNTRAWKMNLKAIKKTLNNLGENDMEIHCLSCGNQNKGFLLPLWSKTTFRIKNDGDIKILHLTPLESLEDKITDNSIKREISCKECGSDDVDITLNEFEESSALDSEKQALEGL